VHVQGSVSAMHVVLHDIENTLCNWPMYVEILALTALMFVVFRRLHLDRRIVQYVTALHVRANSLEVTNRSFRFASPHLWNQLPALFRQSYTNQPRSRSHFTGASSCSKIITSTVRNSSISLQAQNLKTYLFHKYFPA